MTRRGAVQSEETKARARERAAAHYVANRDAKLEYAAQYRTEHVDEKAATDRRWYEANRESVQVRQADPERRARRAELRRANRAADPELARLKFRAWAYSLTVEQVRELLAAGCAACGSLELLHIDHDHACCPDGSSPRSCGRCVRGALCHGCNTALGLVGESEERLLALLAHLRAAKGAR